MNEIKKFLGIWNEHLERKDLICEMDERHIDAIEEEIREAESGTATDMPFNDIFGMPEPSNPKTRMIMPYGNEDIEKFKYALDKIENKIRAELAEETVKFANTGEGNIQSYKIPIWIVDTQTVQQKQKPQGWQEGDPIETYDKTTGNILIRYHFTPSKGKGQERKVEIGFAKALQKYLPDYFEWWQGGKGKEGKHAFFTNNVVLAKQLVDLVNNGYYDSSSPPSKAGMTLFSRHPIDVLRMSDFKKIKSCHSPPEKGGSYWNRCRMEVKDNAGGGVLFTVKPEEIQKLFPDGVIPQKGDIFNDDDRGIYGLLSDPDSRLRVRRVYNDDGEEYAVPDQKIYGDHDTTFRGQSFEFFAEKQKDKFVNKEGKWMIPNPYHLTRYGGSYEDSFSVGQNFLELMNYVSTQANVELNNQTPDYAGLKQVLQANSIRWGGAADVEASLEEPEENECTELMNAVNMINNLSYGILDLMASAECHEDPPYAYMNGYLAAYIPFENLESWFRGELVQSKGNNYQKQRDFERVFKRDDPLGDIAGIGIEYMDLPFEDVEISVEPNPITGDLSAKVQLQFQGISTEPREIISRGRDARVFSQKITQEQLHAAIQLSFQTLGWAKESPYSAKKDMIESFSDSLDDLENFDYEIDDNKAWFEYSNMILDEFNKNLPAKFTTEIESPASVRAIRDEFAYNFRQAFNKRAEQYRKEIEKQMTLFGDMQDTSGMQFQKMPVFIEPSIIIRQDYRGGFPATPEKKTTEIKFYLKIQLDRTLTEEQVEYALRFVQHIVDDEDVILNIAHAQLNQVLATPDLVKLQEKRNSIEQSKKFRKLLKEWYIKQGKK
jgi:hypothetical protein